MTAIDLKDYIYKNHKIDFVLESIGCHNIKYHPSKGYYSCSNADGDNKSAINIFDSKYLNYINYTRGVGADNKQDLISLVQYNKNFSFGEAIKYLHKILDIPFKYAPKQTTKKIDPLNIFKKHKMHYRDVADIKYLNENYFDDFVPMVHIDIFKEGITKPVIKKFGLCYSYKFHRTIFPHRYWLDGRLLGANERTSIEGYDELGIPKYWLTSGMNKSVNLYGLWENRESIEKKGYVVVYESEKSVLKRASRLDETGISLSGHYMSAEQVRILLGLKINEIVIALDNDVKLMEVLNMCEKFHRIRKVSFIKDRFGILGDKDSPADAKDKDFRKLFDNRITYNEKLHNKFLEKIKTNG